MIKYYDLAVEIATKAHQGQVRKRSGLPYITHPLAVAEYFVLDDLKSIAVLHDVLEDTAYTYEDLIACGLPWEIVTYVEHLTRQKKESYLDYILRIGRNPILTRIKLADLYHNMSDLEPGSLRDKYMMAEHILKNSDGALI